MPLTADLPPCQDPELEAREHRNRFNGGTSGGEVSPNKSKVLSVHLHCATTRLHGKAAFIAKLRTAAQDERPARYSSGRPLLSLAAVVNHPWQRAAVESRLSRVL